MLCRTNASTECASPQPGARLRLPAVHQPAHQPEKPAVALPPKADTPLRHSESPLAAKVRPTPAGSPGFEGSRRHCASEARVQQPRSRCRVRLMDENRTIQVLAGDSGRKHHPELAGREPDARGLVLSALFFLPPPRLGTSDALARTRTAGRRLAADARRGRARTAGRADHAASFFAGIDVQALDYSPALERPRLPSGSTRRGAVRRRDGAPKAGRCRHSGPLARKRRPRPRLLPG